jgi:DNA-directed RNA polymerase specialized sigma24 family protein
VAYDAAYDALSGVAQSEVAMTDRFAEPPSFDEYVVARGADLLRTAWLLVGDDRRAEDLVRATLARTWPQWRHLSEVGAGSYDAQLRRSLVTAYLRRPLRRNREARPADTEPVAPRGPASTPPTRTEVLDALAALSRRERATLVLWSLDGLGEAQIADALDDDVPAVHRDRLHALAAVGGRLGLDEESLRVVLTGRPPQDPSVEGLVAPSRRYAARARGARGWALAVVAVVAVAVVGALVTRDGDGGVVPVPTTSEPAALSCGSSFGPPSPPVAPAGPLSRTVVAVLVCAQTDEGSVWAGSLPPDEPVTVPLAIDALSVQPRTKGAGCADLPQGPAFRMLLRGHDGSTTTYANEGLACNGWPALASYYVAVAEQEVSGPAGPASEPDTGSTGDGFLGCPSILGKAVSPPGAAPPSLTRGTVLAAATACLHPRPILNAVPRYRTIRANVMGAPQLAQLNADLARAGSDRVPGSTCATGTSLFVVRARTDEGRLVELSSVCADRFTVDWTARDSWPVSTQTRDMLRALLVVAD